MTENFLEKVFEHNNWANQKIIEACALLSDEQLDAEPQSVTKGSIPRALTHLVHSQQGYLALLTLPIDERPDVAPKFTKLQESARESGAGLLTIARGEKQSFEPRLTTRDEHHVKPWVVMVQVINYATEHREQIKSMMTALEVIPPNIDSWEFGFATNALVQIKSESN